MKHKKRYGLMLMLVVLLLMPFAGAVGTNLQTRVDFTCTLPEIKVSVPSTGSLFINPYNLPVYLEDYIAQDQIVSIPGSILNESVVPVQVDVAVSATVSEECEMRLSSVSTKELNTTRKMAFIYFEIKASDTANPAASFWDSEYDAEKHLVVRTAERRKKNMVRLGAAGSHGCYGAFRMSGDCVASPKTPWDETDKMDVTISFTFKPLSINTVI